MYRMTFGPQRDEVTGRKAELVTLYGTQNIVRHIKANRIKWAGHVVRSEEDSVKDSIF